MANVQLENGFTKIADAILENMAKVKLNGTQFRILLTVWRSTYGWNKKSHALSENYIAKATNIHKQQIRRELKDLIEKGVLIETRAPTFNTPREIQFNKHYLNCSEVTKKIPVSENDTTTGSDLDTPTGSELATQKRHIKKHINKHNYKVVYDYYISLGLVKHRAFTKDMEKAVTKAIKDNSYTVDYCKTLLERHKKVVELSQKTDYPVKVRGFAEFFGQKVFGASHLICSEYEEGGKYYEQYLKRKSTTEPTKPLRLVIRDTI